MNRWEYEPWGERVPGDSISGWLYLYRDDGDRVYVGGVTCCPSHEQGDRMGVFIAAACNAAEAAASLETTH